MTTAIVNLTTAVEKEKNNPSIFSFSQSAPREPREKKEKGQSKQELVTDWMRKNSQWAATKGQDALDAYQASTTQLSNLPYIRTAQKVVLSETGSP